MTADEAELVATWRYHGDSSVYDLDSAHRLLDDLSYYHSVVDTERLIGFCCTAIAARAPGMVEEPGFLDIGMGMDSSAR